MDDARGFGRSRTLAYRPCSRLLRAGSQVRLKTEGVEGYPRKRCEAGLFHPDGLQEFERFFVIEFDQLGFGLCVQEHRFGGGYKASEFSFEFLVTQFVGIDVEGVEERLGGKQEQFAQRDWIEARGKDRSSLIQHRLRLFGCS